MANREETYGYYERDQEGENKHHRDHPQNHPANQSGCEDGEEGVDLKSTSSPSD